MDRETILQLMRTDLQISVSQYDTLLYGYIAAAEEAIKIEGITLDPQSEADEMLVEQYAVWLARKRKEDVPMSRLLRWQLNNRLLSEKGKIY